MFARRSDTLLALSAAALVAAVLGVHLGRGAIAEINPIHFRGVAIPPRGIDPAAARPAPDPFAQAYGWEQGHGARAYDCGGNCDAREARQSVAISLDQTVRAHGASDPNWRDVTPTSEPAAWEPGETGTHALSVDRYMHYPVEEQEEGPKPDEAKLTDEEPPTADE